MHWHIFSVLQAISDTASLRRSTSNWIRRSPVTGRIVGFCVDGSVPYALTESGVFGSTDTGRTWKELAKSAQLGILGGFSGGIVARGNIIYIGSAEQPLRNGLGQMNYVCTSLYLSSKNTMGNLLILGTASQIWIQIPYPRPLSFKRRGELQSLSLQRRGTFSLAERKQGEVKTSRSVSQPCHLATYSQLYLTPDPFP
ncbi:MAG: hypothetical protein NZM05_09560, partial [Chloroherpetonaceae bacterium]|nr:hypothetical protein [Chloroherpetonaceae bacterium]